ncbi:asparagine--tRNA ligase, chloroplastic/mitochondrial [Nicotiana tabacum]|uniref:asparagine--tRNA ligase n=2 Tax=Nicotiana TaxID=4085 RepID=A0A1S3YGP6_TOBAC|nr:PREDICTED: asparagine--tRNA ligase, chloroplastic/mitochondrial [Nicotiana sylvestris]XP_016451300.1 PREDICTED: asparagine--tRNA ligase, chloroplastic/mitochondrial-like [Nicotiana tabacum]
MAGALSPATTLRLKPFCTVRFFTHYRKPIKLLTPNYYSSFPLKLRTISIPAPYRRRSFCSVVSAAISSGEAVEKPKFEQKDGVKTEQVREFKKRLSIVDIKGGPDEGLGRLGETLVVRGWVRTVRAQSSVTFIDVNDGSCLSNMQCVMGSDAEGYDQVDNGSISTGASVWIEGTVVGSQGSKQKIELKVQKLVVVGKSDPSFPIQKKRVSREFLRTKAHLRPRTNTFGAVSRVRNALAYATHKFFQENGFVWVSSPIITASDCEGAGEQFRVTTLIPTTKEGGDSPVNAIPTTESGSVDWSQDFFGKQAFLTVSGQLNGETYATALSDIYTFGPTFRAENSNTSRHLAEFWMIEPELAFADLDDDMACATAYLQYVVQYVLENCKEDMDFFNTWIEKGIINRLSDVVEKNFVQLTYTDAVELLLKAKKKFDFPVKWGCDLQSEHERYITEEAFGGCPIIIRDYPKDIKAFYMRQNDDGKTVAAMDMLVPRVGELIGGSQREERLEYLEERLDNLNLNKESFWWYLDLRRYGSVPHAGFGLGFERLVQFATGIDNIRDAIPFPRTPGSAEF